ncbi:MAG: lamin tail domain-containing protein [Symploca sp. SIO1C4]|uniref:Lamin tail domain-containing protein n=1 Tax=Symploca sp. SIO1C4 TaxID=2607765 RepID=A0A6B3NHZ9_9CYAN|nr:lamin tail domain-containing protein [Symploca sp. SIO2E9]NER31303.1 lamin tail domain-containing protein [Symploca sp. SIO1C4]
MVNPKNPEGGREFVQIVNISGQTASLSGWQVVAPNGTTFELADIQIAPGDIFKFIIPGNGGILRNKAGTIKLRTPEGVIAQNCQYTTEQGRQEGIAILF